MHRYCTGNENDIQQKRQAVEDCINGILKYAAQIIGRPILLLDADAVATDIDEETVEAQTEFSCTLYNEDKSIAQCKIGADGKVLSGTARVNLENNTLVIAKTAVHFFGPPSLKDYGSKLMIGGKCITGFSGGIFEFADAAPSYFDTDEDRVPSKTVPMSDEEIEEIVKNAKENNIHYFSTRGDSMWRLIHSSKNDEVIKAMAMSQLELGVICMSQAVCQKVKHSPP